MIGPAPCLRTINPHRVKSPALESSSTSLALPQLWPLQPHPLLLVILVSIWNLFLYVVYLELSTPPGNSLGEQVPGCLVTQVTALPRTSLPQLMYLAHCRRSGNTAAQPKDQNWNLWRPCSFHHAQGWDLGWERTLRREQMSCHQRPSAGKDMVSTVYSAMPKTQKGIENFPSLKSKEFLGIYRR